jgi:hypothetical protein
MQGSSGHQNGPATRFGTHQIQTGCGYGPNTGSPLYLALSLTEIAPYRSLVDSDADTARASEAAT